MGCAAGISAHRFSATGKIVSAARQRSRSLSLLNAKPLLAFGAAVSRMVRLRAVLHSSKSHRIVACQGPTDDELHCSFDVLRQ
jgi:hypothetical protein